MSDREREVVANREKDKGNEVCQYEGFLFVGLFVFNLVFKKIFKFWDRLLPLEFITIARF